MDSDWIAGREPLEKLWCEAGQRSCETTGTALLGQSGNTTQTHMGVGKHRNNGTVRRNPGEGMEQQYHVHKEYRYDAQPDISSALLKALAPG